MLARGTFISIGAQLKDVDISNNPLRWLEPGAFYGLPNLKSLSLASTELTVIPKGAFDGLDMEQLASFDDHLEVPRGALYSWCQKQNENENQNRSVVIL